MADAVYFATCFPEHIRAIDVQAAQVTDKAFLELPAATLILASTFARSAFVGARCVGAAGIIPMWPGRDCVWALLSGQAGPVLRPLVRRILWVLDHWPTPRVEASVRVDFKAGHKFAKALGFVCEAKRMRGYFPDGTDAALYARCRE